MTSKQVIVMRKDLNMRKGKMVAQGAHASMKAILDVMKSNTIYTSPMQNDTVDTLDLTLNNNSPLKDWIENRFTKICLSVDSEEELMEIYNQAEAAGLICSLIVDSGLTEFNGAPTKTCCAIGPAWAEDVDKITGELKLL